MATTGKKRSYGKQVKTWVKGVYEALLNYISAEERTDDQVLWHSLNEPEIREITTEDLIGLAPKSRNGSTLKDWHFQEAINHYLPIFLGILKDTRKRKTGPSSDLRSFKLTLWNASDKQKNLDEFDKLWDEKLTQEITAKPQQTSTKNTSSTKVTPYHNFHKAFGIRKEQFIGREQALKNLHNILQKNELVAIVGMGGAGKTELSIQYARSQLHIYKGGVCWLPASQWRTNLVEFARTRFPNFDLHPKLNLAEQVAYCWQYWPKGDVLIILDDINDYEQEVKEDLPIDSRFKVLMTTRAALDSPVVTLSLDVLEPEDALKLLKSLVNKEIERFDHELAIAEQLCRWLEYLPLGLELVGRYLNLEPDISISELLLRLQQQALKHESLNKDQVDMQKAMTAERGVEAAFELSWQKLDNPSQHLGQMLSIFAPAPIPWEYVELTENYYFNLFNQKEFFSSEKLKQARRKLIYFHLLKRLDQKTYILHSLIRKFFQGKGEEQ